MRDGICISIITQEGKGLWNCIMKLKTTYHLILIIILKYRLFEIRRNDNKPHKEYNRNPDKWSNSNYKNSILGNILTFSLVGWS